MRPGSPVAILSRLASADFSDVAARWRAHSEWWPPLGTPCAQTVPDPGGRRARNCRREFPL